MILRCSVSGSVVKDVFRKAAWVRLHVHQLEDLVGIYMRIENSSGGDERKWVELKICRHFPLLEKPYLCTCLRGTCHTSLLLDSFPQSLCRYYSIYLFLFWEVFSISFSFLLAMQNGLWDLSSLTRRWIQAHSSESAQS